LNTIEINPDGTVIINGKQPLIIHVTGSYTPLKVEIGPFTGYIKALNNNYLKKLQIDLLKEWIGS
jgi:hypothetical protein